MEIDDQLIIWLMIKKLPFSSGFENISTLGFGPLPEDCFRFLLTAVELEVRNPNDETDILVIGREGWSEDKIIEILDLRSGQQLRVYSQELFLAYLISGVDPLFDDSNEMMITLVADDHPGLNFLEKLGFTWPNTQVPVRVNGTFDPRLLGIGLLKFKGYGVGKNGRSLEVRKRILSEVYDLSTIPQQFPDYYIKEWGTPRSSKRLRKMANTIATICKNAKRSSNRLERAITEWETDLAWLKSTYYDGHYRFQWPATDVW